MGEHTRRFVLASGATTLAFGGFAAWWLTADTPDAWGVETPFLTDASVFYNKWDAKKRDPVFWVAAATRDDINALEWSGDGEDFAMTVFGDAARSEVSVSRADILANAATRGSVALLSLDSHGRSPGSNRPQAHLRRPERETDLPRGGGSGNGLW